MSDPGSRSQSLFKASAEGVKFLVLLQLSSRLLTFVVNQILLRYLSPELLGISVQFELFVLSILYFSRESLRTAVQRYGITTSNTQPRRTSPGDKLLEGTAAAQSQTVVNLSYATIPLGGLFAAILYKSISSVASTQPNFKMSVILYIIATILELLTEPAFAITQQKLLYKIRAGAETAAAFTRCFLTCAITIYYAKTSNTSAGPLPFAIGQFGYAVVLQAIYYLKVYGVAKDGGFSLGLWRLASSNETGKSGGSTNSNYYFSYFHKQLLSLAFSMWIQSSVKHILTQGDSILIAWLATAYDQGIYALASNYGSLAARMLFQPIEESSRNFFAKLLSEPSTEQSKLNSTHEEARINQKNLEAASNILRRILKIYFIISVFAASVGPPVAPILLRIIAGSRWADSNAGEVLSTYCYYIPLLAINGITEAFVQSVASSKELHQQSMWMFGFSLGFGIAGYILLHILEWGAQGLVWANVINMTIRIIWSRNFIGTYFRRNGAGNTSGPKWEEALPDAVFLAVAGVVGAIIRSININMTIMAIAKIGVLVGGLLGACVIREWKFLVDCYSLSQQEAKTEDSTNDQ